MRRISFITFFLLILSLGESIAQKTTIFLDPDMEYKTGLELFDKKKYGAALKSFQNTIDRNKNQKSLVRMDAEYYAAACAIELFHKDGEWRMRNFIEANPESNKVKWAYFYLGKSAFRKKKYEETIDNLEKVETYDLSKDDLAELYFKRGYSYMETGNKDKAKTDLFEIKDIDNKYAHPANYYYSHIAYTEKNYSTALEGFTRLLNNETFGSIVPYYIAQIYFLQEKYDDVIRVAPPLLNDSNHVQKAGEINRIIGESYFNKKDYASAIPYLLKHNPYSTQDFYQLGYAYYRTGDCTAAITNFEKATENKDSLAQNAWYHLADCYLKLNDKVKARGAFNIAYVLGYNPKIKEDALYSYARLCYEMSYSPYNDAIKSFRDYINRYPESPRKEEAYVYLVNCFTSTKNYAQAMKTIEKIKSQDLTLKTIYQKMMYFRGIELYNNMDLDSAKKYFINTINLNTDQVVSALAKYWTGEIYYQKREYMNALNTWKEFQLMTGALNLKEYDIANYNIGYAYFMMRDYSNAGVSFRKFLLSKKTEDALKIADANVRTGDCYFMTNSNKSDFISASDYYETAVALNKIDVDYSIFQKAMCDGLLKNYREKVNGLKMLEDNYPKSQYLPSVSYEIAEAYKALKENENAIRYYKITMEKYPNSSNYISCLMSIGQLYFNDKNDTKAFEYFERVVDKYPNSAEAKDAINLINQIFVAQNKPAEMEAWNAAHGNAVNQALLDAQYFEVARKYYYDDKNCDLAMPEMEKYISKFPNGKFITDAHFCFAECAYSKGLFEKALPSYQFVLSKPRDLHTEIALVKASYIEYKDQNYEAALPLYLQLQDLGETPQNKLSGKLGAMRCAFYLKKYDVAIDEANKVLTTEKISAPQIIESRMIKAKSLFETNRKDEAILDFKYVSKNAKSETGAEAFYFLATINFARKEYKDVERTVNSLINYAYTNNVWNTRGLLLMADVYLAKDEDTNAEATLQAVIDNSGIPEYIEEAKVKLKTLKDKQNSKMLPQNEKNMEILFDNTKTNQRLFDDQAVPADTTGSKSVQPK
ncbi:MAG: tetratricopeptide repeat protein [Bacteroidia bacterium]